MSRRHSAKRSEPQVAAPPAASAPTAAHGRLAPTGRFYSRVRRGAIASAVLVVATLAIGMAGYHWIEDFGWLDAFHQAALLLSGMGPVENMKTVPGKLFDGIYALFCGVVLLVATGLMFAPVIHRILHKFRIEDAADK
jgi:hypothetical protein